MIYIDPPYNTGKDFVYKDDFNDTLKAYKEQLSNITTNTNTDGRFHSNWLNMMYPRLRLAKNLLRDDGVIFISIDDKESAQLKLLCDEIFGQNNFLYQLSVIDKLNGNDNSSGMIETHEYCFIYAKNITEFDFGVLNIDDEGEFEKWQVDEIGFWKEGGSIKATGEDAPREKRPNLFFPLYIDENALDFSLVKDDKYTFELLPITDNQEMRWTWNKDKFLKEKNEIIIKKVKDTYSVYKKQRPALGDLPTKRGKTAFYSPKYSTANSNKQLKEIFNLKGVFPYSKSIDLIKDFISLANMQKDDIILDFFSGSATTAHAVMQLNALDGGNRKYILIQIPEPTEAKSIAYQNGYKNICEIGLTRIKKSSEKIKQDYPNASFDDGVKIFYLDSSNLSTWDGENITQENLFTKLEKIKQDRVGLDLVYEFILKQGYSLGSKIDYKNDKYFVKDGDKQMIICLKKSDFNELLKYKDSEIIIEDDLLDDNFKLNILNNLKNAKTF